MTPVIRRADPGDFPMVDSLLAASARWMHIAGWDAWPATGFPEARIMPAIQAGELWLLFDGDRPVGTVTLDQRPEQEFTAPEANLAGVGELLPDAWVAHKLAADRTRPGFGYGSLLMDWTVDWTYRQGGKWTLVNVARRATGLQAWYRRRGFTYLATVLSTRRPDGTPRRSGYLMSRRAEPVESVRDAVREIP